jgi:deoxyribodipyrimidine photolyase-related protein
MNTLLILGNQLFKPSIWLSGLEKQGPFEVFMREDRELCTYYRFHKHKIIFFLSSMRNYRDELLEEKISVHYEEFNEKSANYDEQLLNYLFKKKPKTVYLFEIEDKFFEKRIFSCLEKAGVQKVVLPSPMFLTPRSVFKDYLETQKKPFMKTFYEQQRKRLSVLVDQNKKPAGGQWSFDEENRLPLPENIMPPPLPLPKSNAHTLAIKTLCDREFSVHPGKSENFWIPTTRSEALRWLHVFLKERFAQFGPYEDAMPSHSDFVFHSVLTPFLNTGLLTPKQIVSETLRFAEKEKIPLASLEGFIRQIIGWREFVRGIYQNYSEQQDTANFWNHKKKLSNAWYTGETGIPQLDFTIQKVLRYGYCHHIERLMVLGNLMLLLEVEPREAHKWFMEMFVDSSDWVMGPNVYGMTLFSDGGIFATKPYICGSNYWRKMSKAKAGDWCDGIDGLYWGFIEKNKTFFSKNPRLSMMSKTIEKMDPARKKKIYTAADALKNRLTVST